MVLSMEKPVTMWEPIGAIVFSIFATMLLFTMVYLTAYLIVKGGFFTYKKIKEIIQEKE